MRRVLYHGGVSAMSNELARPSWELQPLGRAEMGPYGDFPRLTDAEKQRVWREYRARQGGRPPVTLGVNNRVCLQAPELNAPGLAYREVYTRPEAMLLAQLWHQYVLRMRHHLFCDEATGLPEAWKVSPSYHNVYEAAFFGAAIAYRPGELPDTTPPYAGARKRDVFAVDIEHPAQRGFFRETIEMTHAMERVAREATFWGRPIEVEPYLPLGTDGPLTVAMNIRGSEILTDLVEDPDYARELFAFIVEAAVKRRRALAAYWRVPEDPRGGVGLADDSIALLGVSQYREWILPHHRAWFDAVDPRGDRPRSIHLCGDAQRHFLTIRDELRVSSFDTGFPVDFARLRSDLGPEVEVYGGVEVATLLSGPPDRVYRRARGILESGILAGGRFVLREANNLPPGVGWANLAAMYRAAFDAGPAASRPAVSRPASSRP